MPSLWLIVIVAGALLVIILMALAIEVLDGVGSRGTKLDSMSSLSSARVQARRPSAACSTGGSIGGNPNGIGRAVRSNKATVAFPAGTPTPFGIAGGASGTS